jgi:hypothetical protein
VAGEGPLHPVHDRDQPTHAGGQFRGGRRFCERPTEPKGRRRRLGLVDLDMGEINDL